MKVDDVPNNQVEAVITVAPDGQTMLTCFHGLFTETSPGYASTDGGATWERMAFPPEAGPGGDCETAITEDGAWAFLASTVAGATVLVSRDNGTTWTHNPASAIPLNGLADRPWLEAVGNELWLTYMPLNFQPGTVGFTRSTDYGKTWSVPQLIGLPGPGKTSVRHGHPVVADDVVMLPMVRYDVPLATATAQVATSTDNGASWSVEDVLESDDIVADWPGLAVTGSGDGLLALTYRSSASTGLAVVHRPPGGEWSGPHMVHEAAGGRVHWPWIDGGAGTQAVFITEGAAVDGEPHLWIGQVDATDLSVQQVAVMERPGVEFASVDHDAEGNAYAVWINRNDAQYFVKSL